MTQPHEAGQPLERITPGPAALFPVKAEGSHGIVIDDGEPVPFVMLTLACAKLWNDDDAVAEVELWIPAGYAAEVHAVLGRQIAAGAAEAAEFRARGN